MPTPSEATDAGALVTGDVDPVPFGANRPAELYVPSSYVKNRPMPLVVLLHGYGASGRAQELYFGLRPHAEARGFLYVHPDGTVDSRSKRFWNATECCNLDARAVDDVGYLSGLVDEIATRYTVDRKRVYLIGHSNGGFMAHRLACDKAATFAAIVSLAGTTWSDEARCRPSEPVSVLQIHGTSDTTIHYEGGNLLDRPEYPYPGAEETAARWARADGCDRGRDDTAPPLDVVDNVPGAETLVSRYVRNCQRGSEVALWKVQGGAHLPALASTFDPMILDFLFAHPKP